MKGFFRKIWIPSLIFTLVIISRIQVYSWGEKIHYEIAKEACGILSGYLGENFRDYTDYIAGNASLPDAWKGYYKRPGYGMDESPNHYCDYDYYLRLKRGSLNQEFIQIQKKYTENELSKGGTVIWAIEKYSNLLKDSFVNKDFQSSLIYIAVLAHYMGDIHQPLHATENFDGQLTGSDGIHLRYEVHMVNKFGGKRTPARIRDIKPIKMEEIRTFTIRIIQDSLSKVPQILDADKKARNKDKWFSDIYYKSLNNDLGELTENRINLAIENLAILIYSIWSEAGKPEFPKKEEMKITSYIEVERAVFFDRTGNMPTEKTKADERKYFLYSILTVLVFVLAVNLL